LSCPLTSFPLPVIKCTSLPLYSVLSTCDFLCHYPKNTTVSVPRWNWNPPPPLPLASVPFSSPRNQKGGGYTLACVSEGGGVPIRTTGEKAWYSVYSVVLTFFCLSCSDSLFLSPCPTLFARRTTLSIQPVFTSPSLFTLTTLSTSDIFKRFLSSE
jgi:hypothetical protein